MVPREFDICLVGSGGVCTVAAVTLEKSGRAKVTAVLRSKYDVINEKGWDLRASIMEGLRAHYLKICTPPKSVDFPRTQSSRPSSDGGSLGKFIAYFWRKRPNASEGEIRLCCCKHQATPRKIQYRHNHRITHYSLSHIHCPYPEWTQHPPATHQSLPPERRNVSSFYDRLVHGGSQQNKTHQT